MNPREEEIFALIYNVACDKFTKLGMDLVDEKAKGGTDKIIGAAAVGKALVVVGSMFISNSFKVADPNVCLYSAKTYLKDLSSLCRENHGYNNNDFAEL